MSLQHSQIVLSKLKLALTFRINFFPDDGHVLQQVTHVTGVFRFSRLTD